jgi:beta-phosphoglucomutase family hydrolase
VPLKAFIFDLDGVIIDSNPVHVRVWAEYLRNLGIQAADSLPARMYGRHNDEIVRDLIGAHLDARQVREHGEAKERLYREVMSREFDRRLVAGVAAFLARHAGQPMAVASNAEPANVEFVLRQSGLRKYFSVVLDGHQVARPKPDPEIFLTAAAGLGVRPADCLVFEDSAAGLAAARAAGMRVVALRTTHAEFPGADLVIDDFLSAELEPWIRRWRN